MLASQRGQRCIFNVQTKQSPSHYRGLKRAILMKSQYSDGNSPGWQYEEVIRIAAAKDVCGPSNSL